MTELSVILPCMSSTDMLNGFMDDLAVYLMENPSDVEIIVVANESASSSASIIEYVGKRYAWLKITMLQRKGKKRSYGALVRFGLAYSASRYAVLVSPYGEDDLSIITQMLNKIRKGSQVVQATRYSSVEDSRSVRLRFRIYQYIYRLLSQLLLGLKISDSTYGFKMFDRVFIQALGLTQNGYSICPEITLKGLLAGGRVEYVSSTARSTKRITDFKLYKEGFGYLWLLIRGFGHRIGILWF